MVDFFPGDPLLKALVRLPKYRWQRGIVNSIFLFQFVPVQKLDRHAEPGDEPFPLVAHAEGGMRDRAEVTGVSLRRNDLVADVEQRVHEPAVGVIDENEGWFAH